MENLQSLPVHVYDEACALISQSWSENPDETLEYTPDILDSWIAYTHERPPIARGLYAGDQLVAFAAGFPRTFHLAGELKTLLLITWFTVHSEWKGRGLGRRVFADCVRQAKLDGYDGTLHYCVHGNHSNHVTVAGVRDAGFQAIRVRDIPFLMRIVRTPRGMEEPSMATPEDFLRAAEATCFDVPMVRTWTALEAEWECRTRPRAVAVSCKEDGGIGVLAGYVMNVADAARTPCAFIDDVLWGNLGGEAQDRLVASFLNAASRHARITVLPLLGYADLTPFERAGFRQSHRLLYAYLTLWEPWTNGTLPGMYVDVF